MKYVLAAIFALAILVGKAQEIRKTSKVVLIKDSIRIFDRQYASSQFGPSYFVCKEEFNFAFTDSGFEALANDLKVQSPDITAYKSADNKSIICVFTKEASRGIYELHDFIAKHFSDSVMAQAKKRQTIHVQVVQSYDPLDPQAERGFSYN